MGATEFQNFIGKDIKEIKRINSFKLEHNKELNKYYVVSETGFKFYGKTYNNLTITTDDQDIIKDITIYINGIIDKVFYDTFNNNYDLPSDIRVVDTVKFISESEAKEGLGAYVKNEILFTKKGEFEDKPIVLIWNKNNYQIRFFLRYDINISEIKFNLPTDKF